jgi:hypothetical protein
VLTLAPKSSNDAESCFRQAIASARRQKARSLELRAVTSLSRLYHQQGKKEEARQLEHRNESCSDSPTTQPQADL